MRWRKRSLPARTLSRTPESLGAVVHAGAGFASLDVVLLQSLSFPFCARIESRLSIEFENAVISDSSTFGIAEFEPAAIKFDNALAPRINSHEQQMMDQLMPRQKPVQAFQRQDRGEPTDRPARQ